MIAAWFIFWWWPAKQFISRMPSRAEVTENHLSGFGVELVPENNATSGDDGNYFIGGLYCK